MLTVAAVAHAGDPSSGWLSYVIAEESGTITKLSASMVVPDAPTRSGAEPAFWFGVQTAAGDGALIQPIMAKWIGDKYEAFHEIFDWTDRHDEAGEKLAVSDAKLGSLIKEKLDIPCVWDDSVQQLMRGVSCCTIWGWHTKPWKHKQTGGGARAMASHESKSSRQPQSSLSAYERHEVQFR